MYKIGLILTVFFLSLTAKAQLNIKKAVGWLESAYVTWAPLSNATAYNVYYSGEGISNQKIDDPLVRNYGTYVRADVVGLAAGTYTIKVVPVINGVENVAQAAQASSIVVKAHVREGFAFRDAVSPGAYQINGTLKAGAKVLYVTSNSVNTVKLGVITDTKGTVTNAEGLLNILNAKNKGFDKTPLAIRMVGQIKATSVQNLYNKIYIGFVGANTLERKIENVTFEGIGDDATAYGFGFYTKRSKGIEIRNVGIMLFEDDGVSMEADNAHIWVHNCDFFYGAPGSDADQKKGDGSIDMKYNTSNITISFNHFFDSGKSTFAGGATESNPIYFTYHHNWFDHSDSRHPRLCWATVHVYNNYFDGNGSMGLLNTEATSAFVEANHYRNCPFPMMINMQGTNYTKWPTGSQNGGMTKAFNNKIEGAHTLIYQTVRPDDFDAFLVTSRNEQIPQTVKSRKGGNVYSNFDTDAFMYFYVPDSPEDVKSIVTTYAGRIQGGDFKWTFTNAVDDAATDINVALKSAIQTYQTSLLSIQGETGALPVKLNFFTASPDAQYVKLLWSTAFEENNDRFVVERLTNGRFIPVCTIKAKESTARATSYTAYDYEPAEGLNYYRLVQYDKDGRSTVFDIREVKMTLSPSTWSLYPNPASGSFSLKMPEEYGLPLRAVLRDLNGKLIKNFSALKLDGGNNLRFEVEQPRVQGICILQLIGKDYNVSLLVNFY